MSAIEFSSTNIRLIKPDIRNARTHSKKQVEQIAASIDAHGFVSPIIINPDGVIIAGHGRLLAAKRLGLQDLPTITVNGLTEAQERRLRLADNKIALNAGWDVDLLKIELEAIEIAGLDLELTGFSMGEIDVLRSINLNTDEQIFEPSTEAVTRAGDIWICGEHRIACGDLLDGVSLNALMAGEKAAGAFTDPPYKFTNVGHAGGNGRIKHREFAYASGDLSPAEFTSFLTNTLGALASVSRDGAIHFVCMDHHHAGELIEAGQQVYGKRLNIVCWVKPNGGMGSLYRSRHELIFVYRVGDAPHQNNVELGRHGRNRTNVWEYSSVNVFGGRKADLEMHPTVKSVSMVADAIKDVTKRGEIVLDGFLGSGTSLLAAVQTHRRAFGLEIDAAYVDLAITRWMALTGEEARLDGTGETFAEVAQRRDAERTAEEVCHGYD